MSWIPQVHNRLDAGISEFTLIVNSIYVQFASMPSALPREYHVTPYVCWDDIAKEKVNMLNTELKKNNVMLIMYILTNDWTKGNKYVVCYGF